MSIQTLKEWQRWEKKQWKLRVSEGRQREKKGERQRRKEREIERRKKVEGEEK